MNIQELIKLADLLDKKGEHEAASEIDALIKSAIRPIITYENKPEEMDDEPTEVDLNKPTMMDEEDTEVNILAPEGMTDEETQSMDPEAELRKALDLFVQMPFEEGPDDSKLQRAIDYYIENWGAKKRKDHSASNVFNQLSKIADDLDDVGATKEANMIDTFLEKHADESSDYSSDRKEEDDTDQAKRYDSKYHHSLQIREPKGDKERVDREGREEHHLDTHKDTRMSLSTRYCPEHIGDQMARVGPGIYQCSRDGAVFNWETGFDTFDGNHYDGGSISGQTPSSTGYEIPHRVFDSRSKVLNVVN